MITISLEPFQIMSRVYFKLVIASDAIAYIDCPMSCNLYLHCTSLKVSKQIVRSPVQPRRLIDFMNRRECKVHGQIDYCILHIEPSQLIHDHNSIATNQKTRGNIYVRCQIVINHLYVIFFILFVCISYYYSTSSCFFSYNCFLFKRTIPRKYIQLKN